MCAWRQVWQSDSCPTAVPLRTVTLMLITCLLHTVRGLCWAPEVTIPFRRSGFTHLRGKAARAVAPYRRKFGRKYPAHAPPEILLAPGKKRVRAYADSNR